MISCMSIVLSGLPEQVQRVADAVDVAFPGSVDWVDFATLCGDEVIVEGIGLTRHLGVERRPGIQPLQLINIIENIQ